MRCSPELRQVSGETVDRRGKIEAAAAVRYQETPPAPSSSSVLHSCSGSPETSSNQRRSLAKSGEVLEKENRHQNLHFTSPNILPSFALYLRRLNLYILVNFS